MKDILLYGGTEIREGTGTMLVTAVGINTENGRIVQLLTGGSSKKVKKEDKEKINGNEKGENIEMELDLHDLRVLYVCVLDEIQC